MPRWSRYPGRFSIIILLAAAAFLLLEAINGRLWLNDFRVYYDSGNALLNGEPVYGVAHGLSSGFFKYAPVLAMAYVPLALLPYPLAAGIQFALLVLAFVGAMVRADDLLRRHALPGKSGSYAVLFLTTLLVGANLHRELHLGNINILLLWLMLLGAERMLASQDRLAGMLFGLAILAKPHFVVLLPWLVLRRRPQAILGVALSLFAGLLLPLPFLGWDGFMALNRDWVNAMASHNASLIYHGGEAYNAVDTAYSGIYRGLVHVIPGLGDRSVIIGVLALTAAAFCAAILLNRFREGRVGTTSRNLLLELFLLLALVPSLTLTDSNHFLFAMPLILTVVLHLLSGSVPRWFVIAAVPVLLLHGGNWTDALGHASNRMVHYGVLGLANLALIALGFVLLLAPLNRQGRIVSFSKSDP